MYVLELGPGHIQMFRDADAPALVEGTRPAIREAAESHGLELDDTDIDAIGVLCRTVGVSYGSVMQTITRF